MNGRDRRLHPYMYLFVILFFFFLISYLIYRAVEERSFYVKSVVQLKLKNQFYSHAEAKANRICLWTNNFKA